MDASDRCSRFLALTSELEELESSRTAILGQLADVDARIRLLQAKRAADAPLTILPDDVLRLILEETCTLPLTGCMIYRTYAKDQAITMSHVCRRWRQVALSTPNIWKCIHITFPGPSHYDEIVSLFLARSSPLPLSIVTVSVSKESTSRAVNRRSEPPGYTLLHSCWAHLRKESQRWSTCVIVCNERPVFEMLQDHLAALQFPNLQTLHVYYPNYPVFASWDAVLDPAWTAPSLVDVGVFNVCIQPTHPLLQNVVKLAIHEQDLDALFLAEVSNAAHRLMELTLVNTIFDMDFDLPGMIVFPQLRQLTLIDSDIDPLLRLVDAPLLKTLWIEHWVTPDPDLSYSPLRAPQLTELHCCGCQYSHVKNLFFSTVTSLDIRNPIILDYLEGLLPEQSILKLPHLRTLTVSDRSLTEDATPRLLQLFQTMAENDQALRTIRICGPTAPLLLQGDLPTQLKAFNVELEYTAASDRPIHLLTNVDRSVFDAVLSEDIPSDTESD